MVGWGKNTLGQTDIATGLNGIRGIAAGWAHSMIIKSDGTVLARGWNDFGQTNVPSGLTGVSAISGGYQHSLALRGGVVVDPPPVIQCPSDVRMTCVDCNTDPSRTGTATAQDNGTVTVSHSDVVSGDCPKTVVRTWTATDNAGQSASCVQNITCRAEDTGLSITCPPDVIRTCSDCNLEPSQTGVATATGGTGTVLVTYRDISAGECPKVVKRTWTARDDAGQTASCEQRLTCEATSAVTDSSLCLFDRNEDTPEQEFRLNFMQDPHNWPCFRLVSSNPGQFAYNILKTGTPGQELTFNVSLPYPFVTHGANPIHGYNWVTVHHDDGHTCYEPGDGFFVSSQQVTLADYSSSSVATLPITVTVPDSGVVFLSLHLEYGLRHTTGYSRNKRGDAVDCDSLRIVVPNGGAYVFSVSGAQDGNASVESVNNFKKVTGVAGLVSNATTGDPVPGTQVTLISPRGTTVSSRVTDEDGFFLIGYKHSGKAAVYGVSIVTPSGYREARTVTLKANSFVTVDFEVP